MVEFSVQARIDLESIFDGLLGWRTSNGQFYLETSTVINYHSDILDICEHLDKLSYHTKAKYLDHLQFGSYVYAYKRNPKTSWYIIYNMSRNTIYIERIMSNHLTKSVLH